MIVDELSESATKHLKANMTSASLCKYTLWLILTGCRTDFSENGAKEYEHEKYSTAFAEFELAFDRCVWSRDRWYDASLTICDF